MAGGISSQDQQALLKALSSPSPNYSGPIGEPSYPSGILSSGAYAPWAGIGDFQPTPMFQMQGPQVSYSNPNTGFTQYMADLKQAEDEAAAAEAIRNNNNNTNNNIYYADGGNVGEGAGGYGTGYGTQADRFGDMMSAFGIGEMSEAGQADAADAEAEAAAAAEATGGRSPI